MAAVDAARDPRAWDALVVQADDDVAVALRDLAPGESARVLRRGDVIRVAVIDAVPLGHKFAIHPIVAGETIRKYGESIGIATLAIEAGAHVHIHNLSSQRARRVR